MVSVEFFKRPKHQKLILFIKAKRLVRSRQSVLVFDESKLGLTQKWGFSSGANDREPSAKAGDVGI